MTVLTSFGYTLWEKEHYSTGQNAHFLNALLRVFIATAYQTTQSKEALMPYFPNLAIGTRVFNRPHEKVTAFVGAAEQLGRTYVAVNTEVDQNNLIGHLAEHHPDVGVDVRPWIKFTPALNAMINLSLGENLRYILFASDGFPPKQQQVQYLLDHMDDVTLVAGARFGEHEFSEGVVEGTGLTVPWNTFALWNMELLSNMVSGFPMIGDAPFDRTQAGVEELSAIAMAQRVDPNTAAKLVSVPGFYESWNMDDWNEDQVTKHHQKMTSKVSRPAAQLKYYGLEAPRIIHVS